jgi:hypothetical protein
MNEKDARFFNVLFINCRKRERAFTCTQMKNLLCAKHFTMSTICSSAYIPPIFYPLPWHDTTCPFYAVIRAFSSSKWAGDHLTLHCHRTDRLSTVRCDGNHPANYKGCTVYKDLQKKPYPPLQIKQYTPPALIQQTIHTQPGVSYA